MGVIGRNEGTLAEVNSDTGVVKVYSSFTGELVIEHQTSPNDALGAYYALEKAVREAERITYKQAKKDIGAQIVKNLLPD